MQGLRVSRVVVSNGLTNIPAMVMNVNRIPFTLQPNTVIALLRANDALPDLQQRGLNRVQPPPTR